MRNYYNGGGGSSGETPPVASPPVVNTDTAASNATMLTDMSAADVEMEQMIQRLEATGPLDHWLSLVELL